MWSNSKIVLQKGCEKGISVSVSESLQVNRKPLKLEAKGGRKLALQNGKVEGSEVGKNTALFLEAGVKSPLYVALCPDPPAREEREERRKDERQRGERERGERDERDEKEMREMREMRETVRQ